jgi:hypothetical protein
MENSDTNDSAFSAGQFESIYPQGVQDHYWVKARNQLLYSWTKQHLDEPVLEIGAGRGICLEYLHARNIQIEGVEIAPVDPLPSVATILSSGCDALDLDPDLREKFRAVALFDVIEHIENPSDFLRGLIDAYPQVERVFITVPARQELFSNYDTFNGHYRRYDFDTLENHLKAAGLRLVSQRYCFHFLYWPAWLVLRTSRQRNTRFPVPKGIMKWIHSIIAKLLVLESRGLPGSWRGTSIFAVAERTHSTRRANSLTEAV